MRENHYATSCIKFEISQVSTLQDEHNASYFLIYLEKNCRSIRCKNNKNNSKSFILHDYIFPFFYLFYNLSPLLGVPSSFRV